MLRFSRAGEWFSLEDEERRDSDEESEGTRKEKLKSQTIGGRTAVGGEGRGETFNLGEDFVCQRFRKFPRRAAVPWFIMSTNYSRYRHSRDSGLETHE